MLAHAYEVLGFEQAACGDEVFRQLVLARIIEPNSKLDSLRVLQQPPPWPEYYEGYFGAFVRDTEGNNVEAVCHTANSTD